MRRQVFQTRRILVKMEVVGGEGKMGEERWKKDKEENATKTNSASFRIMTGSAWGRVILHLSSHQSELRPLRTQSPRPGPVLKVHREVADLLYFQTWSKNQVQLLKPRRVSELLMQVGEQSQAPRPESELRKAVLLSGAVAHLKLLTWDGSGQAWDTLATRTCDLLTQSLKFAISIQKETSHRHRQT